MVDTSVHDWAAKRRIAPVGVLVVLPVAMVACGSSATSPPSSSPSASTTTTPATASTGSVAPTAATWTALWPTAASATRGRTPGSAAQSCAVDCLHMTNPVINGFQQGDSRSGEVQVPGSRSRIPAVPSLGSTPAGCPWSARRTWHGHRGTRPRGSRRPSSRSSPTCAAVRLVHRRSHRCHRRQTVCHRWDASSGVTRRDTPSDTGEHVHQLQPLVVPQLEHT